MRRRSIARLRRLVRLSEQLYETEVRTARELMRARDDTSKAAAVTRAYLDEDNLVGQVFPELVSARAYKLERRAGELDLEVAHQVSMAAAARGRLKGMTSKLEHEVAEDMREQDAQALEQAIDHSVRRAMASLK